MGACQCTLLASHRAVLELLIENARKEDAEAEVAELVVGTAHDWEEILGENTERTRT